VVLVELSAESISPDVIDCYFTIETFGITNDWNLWPNKVLLRRGTIGPFYSRRVDLPPGPNNIWVGVSNVIGTWIFRIRAKVVSTGQVFADIVDYHYPFVNKYTIIVPNVAGGGVTSGTTPFDPSQIIQQMMENMLPPMVRMMGMMMVMNMMVSMMQGMMSAFAGGF